MLEIEVKYPVADRAEFDRLRERVLAWGATAGGTRRDADLYLDAPDRDFRATDEALRVRSTGYDNLVTYKGPKRDALTKTRREIEVPIAPGPGAAAAMADVFVALGYRPVTVVRKTRHTFDLTRGGFALHVCLDELDGVGLFVELEIVADEAGEEAARAAVLGAARELGLPEQSERRSYLGMLLERRGRGDS